MKRSKIPMLILAGIILAVIVISCFGPFIRLSFALRDYEKMRLDGIPDDLTLTIYYISPDILTRYPVDVESLVNFDGVKVITVGSNQLDGRLVDFSGLQPMKEATYINARLYYVLETDGEKILEVVISCIRGSVFVNGIEVEHSDVFYEFILPFLSAEDRQILGI